MVYQCPICLSEPRSHSLKMIFENKNTRYFYTHPASALKYDDAKGIIEHYDGVLSENKDKLWVWVFDSKGFEMKHVLQVSVARGLADLICNKHYDNLKKIIIMHENYTIKFILNFLWIFLSDYVKSIICFDPEGKTMSKINQTEPLSTNQNSL